MVSSVANMSLKALNILLVVTLSGILLGAKTPSLQNGDFESGDLSGWTVFTTLNGTLGDPNFPRIEAFDTTGNGEASNSLVIKVGQEEYQSRRAQYAGGGIWTTVRTGMGNVVVTADVASTYSSPKDRRNLSGGMFELLFDGKILAEYDMGPIENGATKRFTLKGGSFVLDGTHEIRLQVRRPFTSLPHDHAPRQFVDNIHLRYLPF